MSFAGFAIRWGSMGLGILLLVGGVQTAMTFTPRDEQARVVTPAEALALAAAPGEHFVTVEGSIDPGTRVWDSLVATPSHVRVDANRVYPLDLGKQGRIEEYLGVTVDVDEPLEVARIECQTVRSEAGGETLEGMRVLAPVHGSNGMVWALSPWFRAEAAADAWQNLGSYQGALTRFDDLDTNEPDLGHTALEIRQYASGSLGVDILTGAMIVLTTRGRGEHGPVQASYAAVEGTDGNLLVRVIEEGEPAGPFTGMIDGGPESQWTRRVAGLAGVASPESARVLDTTTSAAERNAQDSRAMQVGLIGGPALFAFGFLTTWGKRAMRKRARKAKQAMEASAWGGISPQQAMALGIPTAGPASAHVGPNTGFRGAPAGGRFQQYPGGHGPVGVNGPAAGPVNPMAGSPRATAEDAALEAEMERWTSGSAGQEPGRRVA